MRITSAGNVGIGTTTPTAKLHVVGTGLFTGLVSGITPVAAANFVTKAYVDGSGGGTGPFLPLAGGTMTGDVNFNDGVEIEVGTGRDLVIVHDGTDSLIKQVGTGNLMLRQSVDDKDIIFQSDNGSGGVVTYFRLDGSLADGTYTYTSWGDNDKVTFGDSNDLQIYHDGSNSYINETGTGSLYIKSAISLVLSNITSGSVWIECINNQVELKNAGSTKLTTTSDGVTVTGQITTTGTSPSVLFNETDVTANWRNRVSSGSYRVQYASDGSTFSDYFVLGASANTFAKDTTFTEQAFSSATSSGDASSTLTTKGYVDSLITGATIYRGTWDPDVSLNSGYGNPNLNTVTQTSGYYYICSADGTATPNGTGTRA